MVWGLSVWWKNKSFLNLGRRMKRKSVPQSSQETQERGRLGRIPEEVALDRWVLEKGGRMVREKLELRVRGPRERAFEGM